MKYRMLALLAAAVAWVGCGDTATGGETIVVPPCAGHDACEDGNPCTLNVCTSTGCEVIEAAVACDDGDPCTVGDQCSGGSCAAGPDLCACTQDADCDDGDACNGAEICDLSAAPWVCAPSPTGGVECQASGPCQLAVCDPASGVCVEDDAADGLPCEDGDACTAGDACDAGACLGGPPPGCAGGDLECGTGADGCSCGECGADGICTEAQRCLRSGDACGAVPPDGACDGAAQLTCAAGALVVEPCADACGCPTCTDECEADATGCSALGTHSWACAEADEGCLQKAWTVCELGCEPALGCLETADLDGDGTPDIEDDDDDGDSAPDTDDVCPAEFDPDQLDNDQDGVGDVCDPDDDDDLVPDPVDNCPLVPNPPQTDLDADGQGDACDADMDGDGIPNAVDNCADVASASPIDTDGDGQGDDCDIDDDGDGVLDTGDVCPKVGDVGQADTDGDGVGDACEEDDDNDGTPDAQDLCPTVAEAVQLDTDSDGSGDACDPDDDGDGVLDEADVCPLIADVGQSDTDGDGIGDACHPDDDGDGVDDADDVCPKVVDPGQLDLDNDGTGDACDLDDDGDGVLDTADVCPGVSDVGQADADGDGVGDACSGDDDADGVPDAEDVCPTVPDPDQVDTDGDGQGDLCSDDDDGDEALDLEDNCPLTANPDQADKDGDGAGDVCDECPDEPVCGSGGGEATIVEPGTTAAYRLQGLVVTPEGAAQGEVLVVGETIACVGSCAEHAEAAGAWVIDTQGVILPGLIDTHNHILFDVFDEDHWVPTLPATCADVADCQAGAPKYCSGTKCACVDGVCKYTNHKQWPNEAEYQLMLDYKQCLEDASQGKPDWCPTVLDEDGDVKCELQKWGELKGMLAGTTSIVGLPGTTSGCVGSLSRSVDVSQNDLEGDSIQTSALFPPSSSSANGVCANYADGDTSAYLIHVGEGVDQAALDELETLNTMTSPAGCLLDEKTAITHGTAFDEAAFATLASHGMKLIWSPASNVALYGVTTNIPAALAAGVQVALAPDWSMGGSQNLLDELRFADAWDNEHWGDVLTAQDLFEMVTLNAATAIGLEALLGTIEEGTLADLVVISPTDGSAWDALLAARPDDVRLVMVGGVPLYGDLALTPAAPTVPGCEPLEVCGASKFVCVAEDTTSNKLDQTLADIEAGLQWAVLTIDELQPLDPAECGGCAADEECYAYGAKPVVDPTMCDPACTGDLACIQAKKSGSNQYQCLPLATCSPAKSQTIFAPIAPLVRCEEPTN